MNNNNLSQNNFNNNVHESNFSGYIITQAEYSSPNNAFGNYNDNFSMNNNIFLCIRQSCLAITLLFLIILIIIISNSCPTTLQPHNLTRNVSDKIPLSQPLLHIIHLILLLILLKQIFLKCSDL